MTGPAATYNWPPRRPQGPRSLDYWHQLGAKAAKRLGVEQVIIDVRTREDAGDPKWAALVAGAGLIYLSGGNPGFLARTLVGTLVWQAIEREWRQGAALAGCSAGAMALGGMCLIFGIRGPVASMDSASSQIFASCRILTVTPSGCQILLCDPLSPPAPTSSASMRTPH